MKAVRMLLASGLASPNGMLITPTNALTMPIIR